MSDAHDLTVFDIEEAGRLLGVSRMSVYDAIHQGELRTFRIGRRRLISSDALQDYVRQREQAEMDSPTLVE